MTFLPKEYSIPDAATGYMKFEQGENRFRILASAIIGWEVWEDVDGGRKPTRFKMDSVHPDDAKHFWAFPVWNYKAKRVQVLEVTQKGIMKSIKSLVSDEDWGDPKDYDIVVVREGEGLDTEYQVKAKPKKELEAETKKHYDGLTINLEALYEGEDPFGIDVKETDLDEVFEE